MTTVDSILHISSLQLWKGLAASLSILSSTRTQHPHPKAKVKSPTVGNSALDTLS